MSEVRVPRAELERLVSRRPKACVLELEKVFCRGLVTGSAPANSHTL